MKMENLKEEKIKKTNVQVEQKKKEEKKSAVDDNYWKIKDLPSKYKLYPEGTVIRGKPLKVLDVKLLSTIDENNFNEIINDVLKRCVTGINPQDLLVPDKLYIIFWLRANTYKDSGYSVEFSCPKCKKQSSYDFSLDTLNVINIKDGYDPDKEITLPSGKDKLKFRYQRVKDEFLIEEFVNKEETSVVKFDRDILNIAGVLCSINGDETITLRKKYDYLIDLNPADYSYI